MSYRLPWIWVSFFPCLFFFFFFLENPQGLKEKDFFIGYGEANRYKILEVVGKGSYGVVYSAIDTHTGEKVAIKKITDIFEHISDAIRILREIKLLRLLCHPDIVEIKRIMLPPSSSDFKDIYVIFELMESDLHQVIKANDDLTHEHQHFFLYQLLRALKYMHTGNVSLLAFCSCHDICIDVKVLSMYRCWCLNLFDNACDRFILVSCPFVTFIFLTCHFSSHASLMREISILHPLIQAYTDLMHAI